ncbi:hypothetical protein LOK49_Contig51G00011 [Camellia lanceoleosa]|nr:hypothetical protein LOK49_Contig51G00011 [Camellia lanceoleosa]
MAAPLKLVRKAASRSIPVPVGDSGKNTEAIGKIPYVKGGKTFADVVKQGRGEDISRLKVLVSEEGSDWLDRTMVVRLKSLSLVGRLEVLVKNFNPNFSIRFGGGNIVLIMFGSKVELDKDFSSVAVIIQDLCDEVRSWGEDCALEPSRLVWLHCFGIPFHVWNPSTFQRIGNLWGDLIRIGSLDSKSLVCGSILVHTRVMEFISSMVYVECNNKQFAVPVIEGQGCMDFAEEMEQKWGLSSHAEHRSESSVAGGRSKNTQRPEVAVGNDEEVQFYSSQKVVGAVVDGVQGRWNSVSAVNESCYVHDGQRVVCCKEGSKLLNCDGPVNDGRKASLGAQMVLPIRSIRRPSFSSGVAIRDAKILFLWNRFRGSETSREGNQLTYTKKGDTLKAAIATFSLASSSKSEASRGRIILNEAQASVQLGKVLGIDFDAQEDVVLSKIADLERNDLARIEQRRNQQGSIIWIPSRALSVALFLLCFVALFGGCRLV